MKKTLPIALIAAGLMAMVLPFAASAQMETEDNAPVPPPAPAVRTTFRAKLQADYESRMENVRNNQDYRNDVLDRRTEDASSTREGTSTRPTLRSEMQTRFASSTNQELREHRDVLRAGMFAWMQDRLVGQLTRALDNLRQIRTRISDRIASESQSGKDMSSAITLLASADAKISVASSSIEALRTYVPTATTTAEITASTTLEVAQARQIGADAIKAVGNARKALTDTVTAIARALGIDIEHASSTPEHE